jgi:mitochondrial protein import protein ZIM17
MAFGFLRRVISFRGLLYKPVGTKSIFARAFSTELAPASILNTVSSLNCIKNDAVDRVESKMHIEFTCKCCDNRSAHQMSRHAYTSGIVVITCPSCSSKHLIADHLGWFRDCPDEPRTIEELAERENIPIKRSL